MLQIEIPDFPTLRLQYLVLDYNGTLGLDGEILPGARARLKRLATQLVIHVVTGDTFAKAGSCLAGVSCKLTILPPPDQSEAKRSHVEQLGSSACVCIGNGRNDRLMLQTAVLAIAVVQRECAWTETLMAADVIATNVCDALDLLIYPQRLVATLRG